MTVPILQIYAAIGAPSEANQMRGIGTGEFAAMLAGAVATGEKKAQVRLNSGGGSWMDAQSILAMMQASSLNIDTYNDGLAASSASLVFMGGRKRYMAAHARLMIHNCSSPAYGKVADLEKTIEEQKAINDSMAILYADRTGLPIERIRSMMETDYWMSAQEALDLGFCDFIVPTAYKAPEAELTASVAADKVTACLHDYYASLLSTPDNSMKHLLLPIMAAAGVVAVSAASPDSEVAAAVQAAFTERDELKRQKEETDEALATAQAKVTELEASQKETTDKLAALELEQTTAAAATAEKAATDLVNDAVKAGKIVAAAAPSYLALAKADLASTTAALAALPGKQSLTASGVTAATIPGQDGAKPVPLVAGSVMAEIAARTAKKPA